MKTVTMNKLLIFSFLSAIVFFACQKKEFDPNFTLPRQFKPGDIRITAGETQATLRWNPSLFTAGKGVTYTVQVGKDSLFTTDVITKTTDTTMIVFTDNDLAIKQTYFARVKANAFEGTAESGWVVSDSFRISGEQIFLNVLDAELTDSSVVLRWRPSAGLTKIVLTPTAGSPREIALTAGDTTEHMKQVTGLTQLTNYTATIWKGNTLKGTVSFMTKEKSIFTKVLSPGDDLVAAVAAAANGEVIGLNPGLYDVSSSNLVISEKTITIQSVSGDATNTKVNFKEVTLKGNGAGVTLRGIEFDGTTAGADYFINLTGLNSDSEAATFTNIFVDNSIVHNTDNAFLRGNRASAGNHKIDSIVVNNTIAYNNGNGSYHYFMIDKLEFKYLAITNSTMYNIARALISWATNMTVPAPPVILIDHSTINNWGFGGRNYILLDANANQVDFTVQNSVLANTPKPGESVGTTLMRASSESTVVFRNNNYFKLNGGTDLTPLSFPSYMQLSNNLEVDLGWTATTTDFTLPSGSPLRAAGTSGGPIGDPRWAF